MKSSASWIKFQLRETKLIRILPPLAGEELPWVIIHQHFMPSRVDQNVVVADYGRLGQLMRRTATQCRANPGRKYAWTERFGDVIVRPQFQPRDHVGLFTLGRQHDNGDVPRR